MEGRGLGRLASSPVAARGSLQPASVMPDPPTPWRGDRCVAGKQPRVRSGFRDRRSRCGGEFWMGCLGGAEAGVPVFLPPRFPPSPALQGLLQGLLR